LLANSRRWQLTFGQLTFGRLNGDSVVPNPGLIAEAHDPSNKLPIRPLIASNHHWLSTRIIDASRYQAFGQLLFG
jgi:hypothetical protein